MNDLLALSPQDFELLIIELLKTQNFFNIEWHGKAGSDRGRDIIAYKMIDIMPGNKQRSKWVVQCKKYSARISKNVLLEDLAAAEEHHPDYWLLCITISLSSNMLDWLKSQESRHSFNIIVWDLPQIQKMVSRYLPDWYSEETDKIVQLSKTVEKSASILTNSQFESFKFIRRFPFQEIDKIAIEQVIILYAEEDLEQLPDRPKRKYSFEEISELSRFTVVLGEPGSGKSTSMQRLAHKLAKSYIANESQYVPIYVELKWYKSNLEELIKCSIRDFCPSLSTDDIDALLSLERFYFLLDGFDDATNYYSLVKDIKYLSSQYRHSQILITSRPVDALNSLPFTFFEITRLSVIQTKQILELYLQSYLSPSQIEKLFLEIGKYGLFGELGNPMFLWFFCLAIRDPEQSYDIRLLPKGAIFRTVVEKYFLSIWEQKVLKDRVRHIRKYTQVKIDFLSKLAFWMIDNDDTIVINKHIVHSLLLEELKGSFSHATELCHDIVDQILIHKILEIKNDTMSFWHKSLRNYFAAIHICQKEDIKFIQEHCNDDKWTESIIMLSSLHRDAKDIVSAISDINPILAYDCVVSSFLLRDSNIIYKLVHSGLKVFFEEKSIRKRLNIIQRLVRSYEIEPNYVSAAIRCFFVKDPLQDFKTKYENLVDYYEKSFNNACNDINREIENSNINCTIHSRIKSFPSVVRKIMRYNLSFDKLYDIFGLRIIVYNVEDCYAVLGIIHQMFNPILERFKDFIVIPKPSRYQAIHTTIISGNYPIEIIIHTNDMYKISEQSYSHYLKLNYGNVFQLIDEAQKEKRIPFIPAKILESKGKNIITVLTPSDEVVILPEGSTVLDFAYKIHSEIGDHCEMAIVNGRQTPLNYPIKNLDQVKIVTNPNIQPRPEWIFMVHSSSIKKKIARKIRRNDRDFFMSKGMQELDPIISRASDAIGVSREKVLQKLMKLYSCNQPEQLFIGFGQGKFDLKRLQDKFQLK